MGWKNIYNIMRLNETSLMNIYRSMMIMLIRTFYWNNWGEIIHYFIYILEFSYQHCLTCLSVINIVSPVYQLSTLSHLFISYQHCLTCLSVINIVSPVYQLSTLSHLLILAIFPVPKNEVRMMNTCDKS